MLPLGFGFVWLGYAYGLYGWCLLRGYDVTLRQLMNPVHIYQWPAGGPPLIPNTQVFPGGSAPSAGGSSGSSGRRPARRRPSAPPGSSTGGGVGIPGFPVVP